MQYTDLRDFIRGLEQRGELKRIQVPVSPVLEMTEICDRTLRKGGPALLFENPTGFSMPVLGNLFGTPERVAMGMGAETTAELREIGKLLAALKEPEPPKGFKDAWNKLPMFKKVLSMAPKVRKDGPCQEVIIEGDDVDLTALPIQTCWPGDAAPLITWGLTITKGPHKSGKILVFIARKCWGVIKSLCVGSVTVVAHWIFVIGAKPTPVVPTLSPWL